MAVLPLEVSRKEQRSVICFFGGQKHLAQMPFSLKCVEYMVTSTLRDQQYIHVWCKTFAHGRENVVDEEESGRHVVSTTDAMMAAVSSLILFTGV